MNVKQAKILLEKINRLFSSMTMDDHVSEIEKELMRNYIKSLYEVFLPESGAIASPIASPPPVKEVPKKVETPKVVIPPKVVETPKVIKRVVETPPPPPKVEIQPEPIPVIIPEPEPEPVIVKAPPIKVKKEMAPPPPPPKVERVPPAKKNKIKEEYEEFFEFKEAKELSERLSQSPIKDLRKAMGINERILTQNELFDGNGDALKDALSTLNSFRDFEKAKEYLANIADIYDWGSKKKKKKARIFIQLVRRRFI